LHTDGGWERADPDCLRGLWHLEKKLLQLLHVDSIGSPTWFLDACGKKTHPRRRLLLTNYDMGVELPSRMIQLGLNFATGLPELFAGKEMAEDAMRVLGDYLEIHERIRFGVNEEVAHIRDALGEAKDFVSRGNGITVAGCQCRSRIGSLPTSPPLPKRSLQTANHPPQSIHAEHPKAGFPRLPKPLACHHGPCPSRCHRKPTPAAAQEG